MKKYLLLLSSIIVLLSCSKKISDIDNSLPETVEFSGRVKTTSSEGVVRTYNYDAGGRLVIQQNSNGFKRTYSYSPGKATIKNYDVGGQTGTQVLELNSQGQVTRLTDSSKPGYEELFTFNVDQTVHTIATKEGAVVDVAEYFYSNGNSDSIRYSTGGTWIFTLIQTYYTDKPNGISELFFGRNFYGKPNTNLVKSIWYRYPSGNTSTPINSTYVFDANGQVIKVIEELAGSGDPEEITYTYYQ